MKIAFLAYRDWAVKVLDTVKRHPGVTEVIHCETIEALIKKLNQGVDFDFALMCGMSTAPSEELINYLPFYTEHPAASDRYTPGTPIQNQILDGIRFSKHRLVKVGYPELSLRQYSHEVDIDLSGNMDDILLQMQTTACLLFNQFLDDYPDNLEWKTWDEVPEKDRLARRVPIQSCLTKDDIAKLTTRELYDFFRCLEDPYPNGYIEDEYGKLYINRVSFKEK